MTKTYCVYGKSGSGKTTLVNQLINDFPVDIKWIKAHTTRDKREYEKDNEYIFDTIESMNKYTDIIDCREYTLANGQDVYYFYRKGDIFTEYNHIIAKVMITTIEGIANMKKEILSEDLFIKTSKEFFDWFVPVYIEADEVRLHRMLNRENSNKYISTNTLEEIIRRYDADEKDYLYPLIKDNDGFVRTIVINNESLESSCYELIKLILKK